MDYGSDGSYRRRTFDFRQVVARGCVWVLYLISKRVMGSSRSRRFIDKCKWNSGVTRPRAARTDSEKHSNGAGGRIGKAIAKGFRLAVGSSKGSTIADRRTEIKQISQSSHSIDPARRRSSSVWHKRSNDTRDPRAQPTNRRSHQKKQVMPLVRPLVKESQVYNDTPYVFRTSSSPVRPGLTTDS